MREATKTEKKSTRQQKTQKLPKLTGHGPIKTFPGFFVVVGTDLEIHVDSAMRFVLSSF